jgi:hypothetical protein
MIFMAGMINGNIAIEECRLQIADQNPFRIPHSAFRIPHSAFRIPHSAFLLLDFVAKSAQNSFSRNECQGLM